MVGWKPSQRTRASWKLALRGPDHVQGNLLSLHLGVFAGGLPVRDRLRNVHGAEQVEIFAGRFEFAPERARGAHVCGVSAGKRGALNRGARGTRFLPTCPVTKRHVGTEPNKKSTTQPWPCTHRGSPS